MTSPAIGIQLFSVRSCLSDDFVGTLTRLAQIGFAGVEFAAFSGATSFGGYGPQELATLLERLDLRCCGLHGPEEALLDPDNLLYDYAAALRCPHITVSLFRKAGPWSTAIASCQRIGRIAADKGLVFTYHNHGQELVAQAGRIPLRELYAGCHAERVQAELDTHWLVAGGADPLRWIHDLRGRLPQLHLKDRGADGSFVPLGDGVLDIPALAAAAVESGASWVIYEQDQCEGDPLDAAERSISYLREHSLVSC